MITAKATYSGLSALSLAVGVVAPAVEQPGVVEIMMNAIGISHIPGPVFVAGLAFAVAGAFISLARQPPLERAEKWWTLCTAILIGTAAAAIQSWLAEVLFSGLATFPPQIFMMCAGLASRSLADWLRFSDPMRAVKSVAGAALDIIGGRK